MFALHHYVEAPAPWRSKSFLVLDPVVPYGRFLFVLCMTGQTDLTVDFPTLQLAVGLTLGRPGTDLGPTLGQLGADFGGQLEADLGPTWGRLETDLGPAGG